MKYLFLIARSALKSVFLVVIFTYAMLSTVTSSETKPIRIVSLSPSLTEILFAIGSGPRVVAVDNFSNYPPISQYLFALAANFNSENIFMPILCIRSVYLISEMIIFFIIKSLLEKFMLSKIL